MNKYTLLSYVLNKPGVLNKIVSLIRKKMYNIDSLTVSKTLDPKISSMTITILTEDADKVIQMMKQIEKLPEVLTIKNLDPETSFWREVAIIKCKLMPSKIEGLTKAHDLQILHEDKETKILILQIAGTSRNIDEFIAEIGHNNLIDITRTGVTAMEILEQSPVAEHEESFDSLIF